MSKKASKPNPVLGTWKIVAIEHMDDDLDENERRALDDSFIAFEHEDDCDPGSGRMRFLDLQAEIDWRARMTPTRTTVEFTWEGEEDDKSYHGRGQAILGKDRILNGKVFYHMGDEREFAARRALQRIDTRKRISSDDKVTLTLNDRERKLIFEETFLDMGDQCAFQAVKTSKGKVALNLDDWEELQGYIASEANHHKDKKVAKELQALWERIQVGVFDRYNDQD